MEKSTTGRGINETHMTWPPVESQERGRETGALPRTSAIKGARPPPARWRIHPPTHLAAPPCKRQREYFVPMDAACPAARRGSEDFGHGAARRSTSRRPPVAAVGRGRAEQPRQTVARARARAQEGEEEEGGGKWSPSTCVQGSGQHPGLAIARASAPRALFGSVRTPLPDDRGCSSSRGKVHTREGGREVVGSAEAPARRSAPHRTAGDSAS